MGTNNTIIVITSQDNENNEKAALPDFKKLKKEFAIRTDDIANNMREFLNKIKPVIEVQNVTLGEFQISEIELSLAITASGGIQLIGKVDASIEGGITLKLSRGEVISK